MAFGAFWDGLLTTSVNDVSNMFVSHGYLEALEKWIQSTSLEDLKIYVAFISIHSRVHWLRDSFYQAWFSVFGERLAQMEEPPKSKENLLVLLPNLMGKYYYRKAFDSAKEAYALEMMKLIQEEMKQHISQDEKRAQTKLSQVISLVIGKVNDALTIDENIADNGRLTIARDAYQRYMDKHNLVQTHNVSENEGDQLFFIAFSQKWCARIKDETMKELVETDSHAPYSARVNGGVMNNLVFAKVFDCKPNSTMNPTRKCKVW